MACAACGGAHSGDRLVLCDGCDSGLHMDCLQPALEAVPEGDWLCPECCGQVRQCQMGREAALRCLQLLLLSDSGRALLLRSGTLQQAVPLLQQRAGEAAAAAAAQGGQQLDGVLGAVRAVLVYARAAVHLLSQGLEEEPTALARGGWQSDGGSPKTLLPGHMVVALLLDICFVPPLAAILWCVHAAC